MLTTFYPTAPNIWSIFHAFIEFVNYGFACIVYKISPSVLYGIFKHPFAIRSSAFYQEFWNRKSSIFTCMIAHFHRCMHIFYTSSSIFSMLPIMASFQKPFAPFKFCFFIHWKPLTCSHGMVL